MSDLPLEDLKQIAAYLGIPVKKARKAIWKKTDPLPVKRFLDRYIAWPSALDAWKERHTLPVQVAARLEELDKREATDAAAHDDPPGPKGDPPEGKTKA